MTVERLNDGLIVTRPDELAIEAVRWTILVRVADVQSPKAKKMEANIHGHAMRLYREIATEQEGVAERSKRVFQTYLERLRPMLMGLTPIVETVASQETDDGNISTTNTGPGNTLDQTRESYEMVSNVRYTQQHQIPRTRRGVSFVGDVMNWAFDTGTEAEVRELRNPIQQQQQGTTDARHFTDKMASVLDKTTVQLSETTDTLNQLILAVEAFEQREANGNTLASKVSMLESALLTLDQYKQWVYETLHELETGLLGERILPRSTLEEIFHEAKGLGLFPLDPFWYYSHVRTSAKMVSEGEFVYAAELPMNGSRGEISTL